VSNLFSTQAPQAAVVTLVLSLLVALTLTTGALLARAGRYNAHRWVQTAAIALNLALVLTVMLGSFGRSVTPGLPQKLPEPYFAIAVTHGLAGLLAVLFGGYVALVGHEILTPRLRFQNYKPFMRTAYGLYMLATALGAAVFFVWYRIPQPTAAAPEATAANELVVPMANFAFAPRELVVPLGATVAWVNQDGAPHNVVADDGAGFRSELLNTGGRFAQTFGAVGTFAYFCELHGAAGGVDMAGVIRVVPAGEAPPAAAVVVPTSAPPTPEPIGELPAGARDAIDRLLVKGPGLPGEQGYAIGLRAQSDELLRHAQLAAQSQQAGDAEALRRHGEHAYNLLAGSLDARFGDLSGDGRSQNPGDGFGLLPNGAQAGYIKATADAAQAAGDAADSTDAIRLHAGHVLVCATNLSGWAEEARDIALRIAQGQGAEADASRLVLLGGQIARGVDANGDGAIAPIAGEGGALVAYEHARYIAGLPELSRQSSGAGDHGSHASAPHIVGAE
jgi:plastocyanin